MSVDKVKKQFADEQYYKDRFGRNRFMSEEFRRSLRVARYADRQLDDEKQKVVAQGVRTKLIVSGGVSEIYRYSKPLKIGKRPRLIDPETGEILNGGRTVEAYVDANGNVVKRDRDRKGEAKRTNARRSKMELRRTVLANFDNGDKFVTLTFRDGSVTDVTDVQECNKAFDRFIKRLKRAYPDAKYCRVIEFQDTNGRGAVHYHCIFTLPYIPYEKLGEMWGNGFVGINAIDHVDNVGAYIQKYMAKDFDDARLAGKKAFATSQNVVKPVVTYGSEAEELIEEFLSEVEETFSNSYDSDWNGKIDYKEFNFNRDGGRIGRNPFMPDAWGEQEQIRTGYS